MKRKLQAITAISLALAAAGCIRDMADQPRYEVYEQSRFFADHEADRPLVEGTVARGHLRIDEHFFVGKVDGEPATTFPQPVTMAMVERGRERFNIYCAQCHGRTGNGQGMVVRRGFPRPPSFHITRLREAPVGYYFDVITNGFGRMPSHAYLVSPTDRWDVIAYVRALQLSQHAEKGELSEADLTALTSSEEAESAESSESESTNEH